jgi:hypothetical protein
MPLPRSLAAAGLTVALAFTLAGCFSPSLADPATGETSPAVVGTTPATVESAPPALAVDPATGVLLTGTGYSLNAPEGWEVPSDAPPQADVFAVAPPDADGFYNTVNVLFAPANGESADTKETNGVAYLDGTGATEVQVRPRVAVAGIASVHFSAARTSSNGSTYRSEQYIVTANGLDYTVTFVFGLTVPQADREALAESALASWTWAV